MIFMPELPEMEHYKQMLNERIGQKVITEVKVNREKSINYPVNEFIKEIKGKKLIEIERRAKHLIFRLDSGKCLLLHLMLGGLMYYGNEQDQPDRTKQIILSIDESDLFFIGLRLGYLHLYTNEEVEKELADLGAEPLDPSFTQIEFIQLLTKRRGMLKTTLTNQKILAGIGNCYSDEICFLAGFRPMKTFDTLTEDNLVQLFQSVQVILRKGIDKGGYIEMPFYKDDNITGSYNQALLVYDREGEPCSRCGNHIVKEVVSSRKAFYCPNCQIE